MKKILFLLVFIPFLTFAQEKPSEKTKFYNFDDLLIKNHIPSYISFLFPLLFLYSLIPFFGDKYPSIFDGFSKLIEILAVLFLIFIVRSLLYTIRDYSKSSVLFKNKPVDSYVQVFLILIWFIGLSLIHI